MFFFRKAASMPYLIDLYPSARLLWFEHTLYADAVRDVVHSISAVDPARGATPPCFSSYPSASCGFGLAAPVRLQRLRQAKVRATHAESANEEAGVLWPIWQPTGIFSGW